MHRWVKTKHNTEAKRRNQYKREAEGEEAAPPASESADVPALQTTAERVRAAQQGARKQRVFPGLKTPFPSAEMRAPIPQAGSTPSHTSFSHSDLGFPPFPPAQMI